MGSLSSLSGDHRIRFNAQLGSSWSSDICIDSVSIGAASGGGGGSGASLNEGFEQAMLDLNDAGGNDLD